SDAALVASGSAANGLSAPSGSRVGVGPTRLSVCSLRGSALDASAVESPPPPSASGRLVAAASSSDDGPLSSEALPEQPRRDPTLVKATNARRADLIDGGTETPLSCGRGSRLAALSRRARLHQACPRVMRVKCVLPHRRAQHPRASRIAVFVS